MHKEYEIEKIIDSLVFLFDVMENYNNYEYINIVKNTGYYLQNYKKEGYLENALSIWPGTGKFSIRDFLIYTGNQEEDEKTNKEIKKHINIIDKFFNELFDELRVIGTY